METFTWSIDQVVCDCSPEDLAEFGCDCPLADWLGFTTDVDKRLRELSEVYWTSDSTGAHTEMSRDVSFGALLTSLRYPPQHIPSRSAYVTLDLDTLEVGIDTDRGGRTISYRALDADEGLVARSLGSQAGRATPAALVAEYDSDVVEVAANMLRARRRHGSQVGSSTTATMLEQLAAAHTDVSPAAWATLARIADGWAGTVPELLDAAAAVVAPVA